MREMTPSPNWYSSRSVARPLLHPFRAFDLSTRDPDDSVSRTRLTSSYWMAKSVMHFFTMEQLERVSLFGKSDRVQYKPTERHNVFSLLRRVY